MARLHFINVREGDCTIIEHNSGRVTMIDLCSGYLATPPFTGPSGRGGGPFSSGRMCERPTNPLQYLKRIGVDKIFRFVLTHPDMDHMDGLFPLFNGFSVYNFWDSGIRREAPEFDTGRYDKRDWDLLQMILQKRVPGLTVVEPRAGCTFKYANQDENGQNGADGLHVLAPKENLVAAANQDGDLNDASYVILYRSSAGKILLPGDAHDDTWEFVLSNYASAVADCSVLFAPHHGRKSGRSFEFLDIVKPRVSIFGCAPSEHLAYDAWNRRGLVHVTQNRTGNIVFEIHNNIDIYIENHAFAQETTGRVPTSGPNGYAYLGCV